MSTHSLELFLPLIIHLFLTLTAAQAQGVQNSVDLLLGLRLNISRLGLGGENYRVLKSSVNMNVVGLDIDIRSKRLFYSDVAAKSLHTAVLEDDSISQIETLLENITNQDGVAWDWVNKKLYWTTAGSSTGSSTENSTVEVMDIQTHQRKLLATYNDGTQARGIVVDPLRGWLFWSDYNQNTAKIVRMSMDGSDLKVLISGPSLQFANGLTYDYETQTLFWIDAGMDVIGSIRSDGSEQAIYVNLTRHFDKGNIHGFNLEFFGGDIYFSDWRIDGIRKISSANTSSERGEQVRAFGRDPTTVRILHIDRQPERLGGNPCSGIKCGTEGMCLLSATNTRGYSCVCPTGADPLLCGGTMQECFPDSCLNGGTCSEDEDSTITCQCTEGYKGHDCSTKAEGTTPVSGTFTPPNPGANFSDYSVSGTLFLGVVGSLLGVIILLTLIIAMIVCTTLRSGCCRSNSHRTHSIGGLSDHSPRDSPTHVVVRGLSDHDYISIKSRDSPAPRGGIIINIEGPGTTALNQYSIHKPQLSNPSNKDDSIIQSPKQSSNVTNEIICVVSSNHPNNSGNIDDEPPKTILERSLGSSVQADSEFNSLNRRRNESLL